MTTIPLKTKDKASCLLNAGILAGSTSIVLVSGGGASFPAIYSGSATSGGSATTLNSTGIGSSGVAVGDYIRNVTDGSWAIITVVASNSVTTTRLKGGTDNSWDNSDSWRVNEFVATLATKDPSTGLDSAYEEVFVTARSTDTVTVTRGYNSTTAQAWTASDYFELRVTFPIVDGIMGIVKDTQTALDTATSNITTAQTDITAQKDGSYHYVVTTGSANAYVAATPALAAYAAGNMVVIKANFTNTGAATINVNSLGAQAIKKTDGATALSSGDIQSGAIYILRYDGTNFQLLNPSATTTTTCKVVYASGTSSATLSNPTSTTAFDTHTYAIPANDLVAGIGYEFEVAGDYAWGAGTITLSVQLGSTTIVSRRLDASGSPSTFNFRGSLLGTASAGASVSVRGNMTISPATLADLVLGPGVEASANVATNGGLTLQFAAIFSSSNGTNAITLDTCIIKKVSATPFS